MLLILLPILLLAGIAYSQPPDEDPASYRLVFADDFDTLWNNVDITEQGDTFFYDIDINKWMSVPPYYQTNYKLCDRDHDGILDTIRYEFAYYMKHFENAEIDTSDTGILKLITKRKDYIGIYHTVDWHYFFQDTAHYTSQMLFSTQIFKYGYFEIKFRIPYSDNPNKLYGLGPNFWLWGDSNICHVSYSEIDVFEYDGYHPQTNEINYYSTNIHFEYCNNQCPNECNDNTHYTVHDTSLPPLNFSDGNFHTMGVKWLPYEISFYVDGVKTRTFYGGDFSTSMLCPMHIFVDVNIPTVNYCHIFDTAQVMMPYVYEVDYVKVWSIDRCNVPDTTIVDLSAYSYNNNNYFNIVNIEGNSVINQGENISVKAAKIIRLKTGFKVKNGANFKAILQNCSTCSETRIY